MARAEAAAGMELAHAQFRASSSVDNIVQFPQENSIPPITQGKMKRKAHWPTRYLNDPQSGVFYAAEQLKDFGAPKRLRIELFNKHGEFRYKDTSGKDILSLPPDEAFEHVVDVYRPIYEAIGVYLDEPNTGERPYNDHGERHIRNVHATHSRLLREAGHIGKPNRFRRGRFSYPNDLSPEQIERVAGIADAVHDGGYLIDPEDHPDRGIELLDFVLPQLALKPKEAEMIRRAVYLHEGDTLLAEMQSNGVATHAEAIEFLSNEYPFVPGLILADKIDQNRSRVRKGDLLRQKALYTDPKLFLEDPHVEINLLLGIGFAGWVRKSDFRTETSSVGFGVQFDFDQEVGADELKDLSYYAIRRTTTSGYKIDVSQSTRAVRLSEGTIANRKNYLDLLMDRNNEIGASRQLRMVISSFALNPEQEHAEIVYRDRQTGRGVTYEFNRDRIDHDIENFWATIPEGARNKREPGELKI
jgi:hypothetical protein